MQPPSPSRGHASKAIEDGWRKQTQRVIAHVDLDAFYCQVEVKNDPERLKGKPVGVVQYNPFGDLATHTPKEDRIFNDSNGSLIAVSYEARSFGVKRNMRGDEARKRCAEVQLVQVPTAHGKADLTHYRMAGKQVTDILARLAVCEKASIDECYLDISAEARRRLEAGAGVPQPPVNPQQVHVSGEEGPESALDWYRRPPDAWGDGERLLACGAAAVADLRAAVREELGFSCSAGIAHCKILAKLASGLHKPSQQTVVSRAAVPGLLRDLPIEKLRQLGGKFGEDVMQQMGIETVGELAALPKARLEAAYGDAQAQWLHELAHGIDADEVKQRTLPKSISCGKTFQGGHALRTHADALRWLRELGRELEERVAVDRAENAREPKLLTIHAGAISRSGPLRRAAADAIAEDALALLKKWTSTASGWSITGMSLGVSNFVAAPTGRSTLSRFMKPSGAKRKRDESANGAEDNLPDQSAAGEGRQRVAEAPAATEPPLPPSQIAASSEGATAAPEGPPPATASSAAGARDGSSAAQQDTGAAKEGRCASGQPVKGIDAETWAALPAEIQRELRLAAPAAAMRPPRASAHLKPGKRKRAEKPSSIASFFGRKGA